MKKLLLALIAGAASMLTSFAHANVISFDELNANGKLASISKYNPYDDLTWSSNWYLGVTSVAGYSNGAHSGAQFVTNGFGVNNLGVSSTSAFDFEGAWFATPNTNGSKAGWINITAYDLSNQLIGSTGNIAVGADFSWVEANFANVGRLNIARDKGWFVMDDFSIRDAAVVPEPGSAALLVLALVVLARTRRRKFGAFASATMLAGAAAAAPVATLDRNGAWVSVEAYGPNIVHVTIAMEKAEALKGPGYGILSKASDNSALRQASGKDGDTFTSPALSLHINAAPPPHVPSMGEKYFAPQLAPVGLQVKNTKGETILNVSGWEMSPQVVNTEKTYQVGASFTAPADEHYYGMGQHQESTGPLDLRGHVIDCKHWYDAPAGESVCVPFMVSSKGYGIVWDNPSQTRFIGAINGRTSFQSNVGERVSFFVITGATPDEIYSGYARLTGKTPIPPKAAFGLIQSKARYESQQEVLRVANTYRQKKYPLDVMVVDWFYWTRMGQLDIDPAQFPDPDGMNRQLHDMGMQSIISIWPRFETSSRYYNLLDAKGYLLKDKDGKSVDGLLFRSDRVGGLIDATNPEARKWFWEHARDNILSHGFDYPWLDETEPDLVPDGFFYSIGSGDRYRNLFPLLHVEGAAEGMRAWKPNKRVLILSRAAYLGAQRTGALFWSSDIHPSWEALARQVPTGLNMTASGFAYWGNDIGGWQSLPQTTTTAKAPLLDPSDARETVGQNHDYPELFTRWFQYGTFLPTLRVHGDRKHAELWSFGRQAETVLARYDQLRYRLIPYIYSQAKTTYDTGAPFMRPLWMDFPHDPRVANLGTQYMFGPAFLVAPVTEQGQTRKDVYLPAGSDWYNFWTNEKLAGGQWVNVAAPIEQMPVFVKAGSIVPIGADIQSTATRQAIAHILVYPGKNGDFGLYDDDGVSYDYEKGKGSATRLQWNDAGGRLTATGGDKEFAKAAPGLVKVIGR